MKHAYSSLCLLFSLCYSVMNAQINMSNATNTVNVSTLFYDDGGPSANYTNNQNLTQVITTSIPNFRIKANFSSFVTINANDSLSIYDGASASLTSFIGKYYASATIPALYSSGNNMTFRFVSDATGTAAGWAATLMPFGIASISQTTTAQSSSITFSINGTNTDWNLVAPSVYLIHSVTNASLTAVTTNVLSPTQLQVTFNVPCNADLGLYHLRIIQPTIGTTAMPNAFNVTPYSVSLSATDASCSGYADGSLVSSISGGSTPFSYFYTPVNVTTPNASSLSAGVYTLSVIDANSCSRSTTATINQPPMITHGYPNSQTICSGQGATLTMTASGGVGGYTYTWTGPNLSSNNTASTIATPLTSTTYTYSVRDANLCAATSTLIVNVNALPSVTVSAAPNIICDGSFSSLNASGAVSYAWNTGSTTSAINVNPSSTTIYSVTGTGSNGCAKTETVSVTVNPNPVVTATVATPLCLGGNVTFINNTTGVTAYSWSGPSSYMSTASNPVIPNATYAQNGTYTLTAISAAGCSASNTVAVIVNALPSLTVSAGSNSVCAGSTVTVSSSGAVTYTWAPGSQTGSSQTYTPSTTTAYTVSGTDANGCVGINTVAVTVNPLTAFNGTVTAASAVVSGSVTLYKYEPFLTKFDSVTTQTLNGAGAYNFSAVPSGSYIVKATPSANTLQVTYGSNAIGWKNATVTTHDCINASTQNISVQPFSAIGAGPGSLSGTITQTVGFGQRPVSPYSPLAPGQPIGGIVVKGGKNPGGNMFAQTTTDASGTYTLSGLPTNTGSDYYFILVDIPGLDTNGTYRRVINTGNLQYTGLDFTVDSARINPVPNTVGINDLDESLKSISVYPNPASQKVSLQYTLQQAAVVNIELTDVLGKTVRVVSGNLTQETGLQKTMISLNDLEPGMYFIRLKTDGREHTLRLMIND